MSKISKEQSQIYNEELLNVIITSCSDKSLARAFIADVLSPSEYKDLSIRWQIIKKLVKGEKHRKISSDLKIGIGTVARGSRELADKNGGFWKMVNKMGIVK